MPAGCATQPAADLAGQTVGAGAGTGRGPHCDSRPRHSDGSFRGLTSTTGAQDRGVQHFSDSPREQQQTPGNGLTARLAGCFGCSGRRKLRQLAELSGLKPEKLAQTVEQQRSNLARRSITGIAVPSAAFSERKLAPMTHHCVEMGQKLFRDSSTSEAGCCLEKRIHSELCSRLVERKMAIKRSRVKPDPAECRWCGSPINRGFRTCPVCHRSQSRLFGKIGPVSNWIAVVAAILTFAQLVISVRQNADAAKQGSDALKQVRDERSQVEEMRGRIDQIEQGVQASSHAVTAAVLKLRSMEIQINRLGAERRAAISDARSAVESARRDYAEIQARLAAVRPTIDVRVPRAVSAGFLGLQRRFLQELQQRQNPEFAALKDRAEVLSEHLKQAEAKLAQVLGD